MSIESMHAYIPIDRRAALAYGQTLPERAYGAALFADISGFTPLTEALVRMFGARRGAEELTHQLNVVYSVLIDHVHRFHGSVIGFSGDAITCWFDGDDGLAATACALAMQQTMQQLATIEISPTDRMNLAMKAAIATGPVRRFLIGDPSIQYLDALVGKTLERMATAESYANKGEVVLDSLVAQHLGDALVIHEWRQDEHGVARVAVISDITRRVPERPWPPIPPIRDQTLMRSWLLKPVYERLVAGQERFLAEIRPAVSIFVRFSGIDYDEDPHAGQKLDAYIRWLQGVFHRYEGTLIQLTVGDKGSYIYGAFGAPLAHDDDALRAVAVAFELQHPPSEFNEISRVQIGITRGQMRTGAYGGSNRRTYGILGDDVNLSARLMAKAEPGQILVSDRVVEQTSHSYQFQSLGYMPVKGKREPIHVSRAVRKKQLSLQRLQSLYKTPLVGRQQELSEMEALLDQSQAGQGQIIRVTGGIGIGKSHLIAELSKRATARGFQIFAGSCQSISQEIAYTPWQQIFRAFFAIEQEPSDHSDITTTAQQQAQVEMLLLAMNPEWLVRLPLLGDLLDLYIPDTPTTAAFDPRLRQESLFALVLDMIQMWTQDVPMVFIIEDAHWMDEPSVGLVLALSRIIDRIPLLLVLGHGTTWQSGMTLLTHLEGLAYHHVIQLGELSNENVTDILAYRLQGALSPLARELIHVQSQGNPFFAQELVTTLSETGKLQHHPDGVWHLSEPLMNALQHAHCLVRDEQYGQWRLNPNADIPSQALGIPDSVQGVVLSRLDVLPEAHKLTLKVASVIGRVFPFDVLWRAHPSRPNTDVLLTQMDECERWEFVHIETPAPRMVAIFQHNTTREATYETLLEAQRRELHRVVGSVLETLHPEEIEQLAHHYSRSAERQKAMIYLERTARKLQHDYANESALSYYQQALSLAERWEWRQEQVNIYHIMGRREAEEQSLRALEASPGAPAIDVAYLWGRYHEAVGNYAAAHQATEQALQLIRQQQADQIQEVRCLNQLAKIAYRQGDYTGARTWYQQALDYVQQSEHESLSPSTSAVFAQTLDGLGGILFQLGNVEEARTFHHQALTLNRTSGNRQGEASVLNSLGIIADVGRNLPEAIDYYQQALTIRRSIGDRDGEGGTLSNLAGIMRESGEYVRALDSLMSALHIQQETGNRWGEVSVLNELGLLHHELGVFETAREYLERGLAVSLEIGDEGGQAYMMANLGLLCSDQGAIAEALDLWSNGLMLVQAQDSPEEVASFLTYLSLAEKSRGNNETARTHAQMALEIRRDLDLAVMTTMNLTTLATLALNQGDEQRALAYVDETMALLEECHGQGPEFPQQDYFICSQIYAATGRHEQAMAALNAAYQLVISRADMVADSQLRESFLRVPRNREVVEAWRVHQASTDPTP